MFRQGFRGLAAPPSRQRALLTGTQPLRLRAIVPQAGRFVTTDAASSHTERENVPEVWFLFL